MLQQLEEAAAKASVKVSYESLPTTIAHGGLCRVRDQYRVIIDKRASVHERVTTLAQALAQLDLPLEGLGTKNRQLIAYYRKQGQKRAS